MAELVEKLKSTFWVPRALECVCMRVILARAGQRRATSNIFLLILINGLSAQRHTHTHAPHAAAAVRFSKICSIFVSYVHITVHH